MGTNTHAAISSFSKLATENADLPPSLSPWWKNKMAAVTRKEIGDIFHTESPFNIYGNHMVITEVIPVTQNMLCSLEYNPL